MTQTLKEALDTLRQVGQSVSRDNPEVQSRSERMNEGLRKIDEALQRVGR